METEPLSKNFLDSDSLSIKIMYQKQLGCTERAIGKINIKIRNGKVIYYHMYSNPETTKTESFKFEDQGVINLVVELESKSNDYEMCGGIDGGSAYIKLDINNQKTEFGYCLMEWNGLNQMIAKLKEFKEN